MNKVEVSVKNFNGLFPKNNKVVIPDYQRPYVWGKAKAEELLQDFKEFFLEQPTSKGYYLGSLLFFYNREKNIYEVIDGQQRITTLLIIKQLLAGKLPDHQNVKFNSHQSIKYIKEAGDYFKTNLTFLEKLNEADFLNRLEFTLVVTHSEDDAFTFFDTQNNRGIKLSATDFLKAYHLRAIDCENLQEKCAQTWEKTGIHQADGQFLPFLFDKILWRARNWRGQKHIRFESKDNVLHTFQKATHKPAQSNTYPLYPNSNNRQFVSQQWSSDWTFTGIPLQREDHKLTESPFSLRQPLHKGLNFFHYTQKYTAIYEHLFYNPVADSEELKKVRKFYNTVYCSDMSAYLREFMQLCLVMYYDAFGEEKLLDAAHAFDYLIGGQRLEKKQIKREALPLCLRENPNNLLDVISQAYLPTEVFDFIYSLDNLDHTYREKGKEIKTGEGVQGRYKQRVLNYFNQKGGKLHESKTWRQ